MDLCQNSCLRAWIGIPETRFLNRGEWLSDETWHASFPEDLKETCHYWCTNVMPKNCCLFLPFGNLYLFSGF